MLRLNKMAGTFQKKILLLLFSGLAMGLSGSPLRQYKIMRLTGEAWEEINKDHLRRSIRNLYKSNLVKVLENSDSTVSVVLTKEGKEMALKYDIEKIKIKKQSKWDKKWRIILFDIPEKHKKARDALRFHLKKMSFFEYQKSVFVIPFPCFKEITFLTEFYKIKPFIRHILAEKLDNELHLKSHFDLL